MRIVPKNDRVVVIPSARKAELAPGIAKPDTFEEIPEEGTVHAVGPGRWEHGARTPMDIEVGETVMFTKHTGSDLLIEGVRYLVLGQRDVLVALKD